jgi:hypothetical protein
MQRLRRLQPGPTSTLNAYPGRSRTSKTEEMGYYQTHFTCNLVSVCVVLFYTVRFASPVSSILRSTARFEDNASDNKSETMMMFCQWLVENGVFKKIKICYLIVGHTHEDIGTFFLFFLICYS